MAKLKNLLLFLLIPFVSYSQCEVHIVEGTSVVYDHNPGISFGFQIQNDSDLPYTGGTLGLDWTLSGNTSGPIWEFELSGFGILLPGQSKYIGTPVFDIPLPENVPGNWPWYGGWTGDSYFPPGWALFLDSEPAYDFDGDGTISGDEYCWDYVTDPTQPNGYFANPSSDGCDNPDGDVFCNDACSVELVDFDLETGELTIIPHGTYCPNNNSPYFAAQYPFDNPYIFGFSLYFLAGGQGFEVSIGNQQIYESSEPITLTLNSGALNTTLNNLLEAIEDNEYCDLTLTIFNLNNSGQPLFQAPDNQTIELLDLCPPLDIIDLSVDTLLYTYGCDSLPYWIPEIQLTNQGNVPITEWCIKFQALGQINDTICFDSPTIMPGETYLLPWPNNIYNWDVTMSIHALHVNGVNDNWWQDFGEDNAIANNMYSQVVMYNDECEPEEITELTYVNAECYADCDLNGPFYYVNTIWTNTGNVEITNFCAEWDVTGGQGDVQECFNGSLMPGDTTDLIFGPYTSEQGLLAWAYLQVLNGVTLDPQIENYETLYCFGEAVASCVYGCIDDTASNYNPDADIDDDSCVYDILGCTIVQACNYNPEATVNDGSCDFESCAGCMDPEASNYDPEATIDTPGLCEYDILGCTDETAFNYSPFATVDDGSCIPVVVGCMIPIALNYNPDANTTCVPIDECCVFPIEGCTDPGAINYNPEANVDDGSCEYVVYIGGCTDPEAINYNIMASYDDGSCVYDPCNGILGATYYAPNTFTPNNDGVNDGWTVVTNPECWLSWQVLIFNRWGQIIWESYTPGEVWPGSVFGGDHYVADGIYFYQVKGVGYSPSNTFQTSGNITVFR